MRSFSIIATQSGIVNPDMEACKEILRASGIPFTEIADVKGVVSLSRAMVSPAAGFVIVAPDETILLNSADLRIFINTL